MTEFSGFRWSLYFLAEYVNMIVVASVATTLFLGGWLRTFSNVHWLNFLDLLPPLLMIGVAGYCVLRMPKQPTRVQQMFMLAVAGLCLVVALVLAAPVLLPFVKPSLKNAVAPFYAGIHGDSGSFQGERVHLLLHVAAFYDTALPVRSTDAAGMAFP
jgi:hypothetical protein